jgi:hypothetical protein
VVSPGGRIQDPLAGLDVEELMGMVDDEGTPS